MKSDDKPKKDKNKILDEKQGEIFSRSKSNDQLSI